MNLNLILVLLISSVVIASGSSCDNNGNVTIQDPKYFKSDEGFFFIHGLTNGESVVMYKTPDEQKVQVRYTFINDDCLYETTSYNMNENGSFVDHVKVLKKPEEFTIDETLSFIDDGKAVEIKFKINKTGFELNDVTGIKTFEPEIIKEVKEVKDVCKEGLNPNEIKFEFEYKDATELNYKQNGRFFYQIAYSSNFVAGTYVFKTSSNDYYTFDYQIFEAFQENTNLSLKSEEGAGYNVKNSDNFSVNVNFSGISGQNQYRSTFNFCFKSTGVLINITDFKIEQESSGQSKPTSTASKAN